MSNSSDVSGVAKFIRNLAILMLILFPLAPVLAKLGIIPAFGAMGIVGIAGLLCILFEIIVVIWLMTKPSPGTKSMLRQAGVIAFPVVLISGGALQNMMSAMPPAATTADGKRAMIHNISTDTQNPPAFSAAYEERGDNSNPLEYGPELAAIQAQMYPDLTGITSELAPNVAFEKAVTTVEALGWDIYAQSAENGIIEAVDTTVFFSFKDDVVIRITATTSGSKIDLRSVSRVGGGDMGKNADRIRAFIKLFNSN